MAEARLSDLEVNKRRDATAERMRRFRDRRRAGFRVVAVEIHINEVAELVRRKLLLGEDVNEPAALSDALVALLEEVLGGVDGR